MDAEAMMIPLSRGLFAQVDAEDYAELSKFKWSAAFRRKKVYAVRRKKCDDGVARVVYMHREIAVHAFESCDEVDHRDGNGLNNRRGNLRSATRFQNACNTGKPTHGKTSKYKGVHKAHRGEKWISQIRVKGRCVHLGMFNTEEEAKAAYDKAAVEFHGEFART